MGTPLNTLTFSERLEKYIFEKGLSKDEMFKCLNILLDYGGVKKVSDFAKENNKSVQAVYQYDDVKILLGIKVVFDDF